MASEDRERIVGLVREIQRQWAIAVTDDQLEAIVRVALKPPSHWDSAERWETGIVETAMRALKLRKYRLR